MRRAAISAFRVEGQSHEAWGVTGQRPRLAHNIPSPLWPSVPPVTNFPT
jgi:hypothetical protein